MSSPARSSGEEPLIKKTRRKKKKKPSLVLPQTIPSLPDDLLLSCFARTSRLYYPTLSLVSKSFRSLLASPELYKTRSFLGRTESCLYVCLQFPPYPNANHRWFSLCRKPNRKKEKKSSSCNLLVPITIPNSPQVHWQGVVTVDSSIYAIGGTSGDSPSSSVWVLDCHFHVWRKAPSMRVERNYPAANVFDGKIYVAGGCKDINSSNWMEVFDPKTQIWEHVLCPIAERCRSSVHKSAVIEGRIFYMFGNEGVAYKPEEDRWEAIGGLNLLGLGWPWHSYCVIDNVLYCCRGGLKWYDSKRHYWMSMKGLKGLPKFASYVCVKLAGYGGKLAVFWTKYFRSSGYKERRIWCAVIALERRNGDEEIWGTVEWLDPVLTVPNSYTLECALAPTV